MSGTARRVKRAHRSCTLRLERLESRALLSSDPLSGTLSGTLDPATTLLVRFKRRCLRSGHPGRAPRRSGGTSPRVSPTGRTWSS